MATLDTVDADSHLLSTQIDHIIILLSAAQFENVPSWLSDNFTIIEGGTHSKGTSRNKLIIFKDGTYLELFSWVDPQPEGVVPHADFPSWADKPEGYIIDWALTGADAHSKYDEVTSRLKDLLSEGQKLNVTYDEPLAGGRRRKDGQELRWVTTRPRRLNTREGSSPPNVPFFCHDISPRVLRVPYTEGSISDWPNVVTHPCGAVGIFGVTIEVPGAELESLAKLYEALLGATANEVSGRERSTFRFNISSPEQAAQLNADSTLENEAEKTPNALRGSAENVSPSCFVQLEGLPISVDTTQTLTSGLQKLVLLTEKAERKGRQLDAGGFGTPISLA